MVLYMQRDTERERESKTANKKERGREMMCCFNANGDCESKSLVRKLLSVCRED